MSKSKVSPLVAKGKALVIESGKMKNRRVEVIAMNRLFDSIESQIVGRTVNVSALAASACHRHRERI